MRKTYLSIHLQQRKMLAKVKSQRSTRRSMIKNWWPCSKACQASKSLKARSRKHSKRPNPRKRRVEKTAPLQRWTQLSGTSSNPKWIFRTNLLKLNKNPKSSQKKTQRKCNSRILMTRMISEASSLPIRVLWRKMLQFPSNRSQSSLQKSLWNLMTRPWFREDPERRGRAAAKRECILTRTSYQTKLISPNCSEICSWGYTYIWQICLKPRESLDIIIIINALEKSELFISN